MGVTVEVWWSSLVAAERGLLDLLDDVERDRVRSLGRAADQGRSLVAAALLRVAAAEHLGVPPADVVVDRTCPDCGRPHGRPRVRRPGERGDPADPGEPAPHVSVSHSGVLVVVALCAAAPVGVDVQRVADLGGGHPDGTGDEPAAVRWAEGEAALKAGAGTDPPAVRALPTPLAGYVAALATRTPAPAADGGLRIRHWPDAPPGRAP